MKCSATRLNCLKMANCAMSKIMSIEEEEPPFSQPANLKVHYCSSGREGPGLEGNVTTAGSSQDYKLELLSNLCCGMPQLLQLHCSRSSSLGNQRGRIGETRRSCRDQRVDRYSFCICPTAFQIAPRPLWRVRQSIKGRRNVVPFLVLAKALSLSNFDSLGSWAKTTNPPTS